MEFLILAVVSIGVAIGATKAAMIGVIQLMPTKDD
tara:strand:+ start:20 stop:124 length:105 start_codon:yes stop_codon:yes gene_type:complete